MHFSFLDSCNNNHSLKTRREKRPSNLYSESLNKSDKTIYNEYASHTSTSCVTDDYSIQNLGDTNALFGLMTTKKIISDGNAEAGTIWVLEANGWGSGAAAKLNA